MGKSQCAKIWILGGSIIVFLFAFSAGLGLLMAKLDEKEKSCKSRLRVTCTTQNGNTTCVTARSPSSLTEPGQQEGSVLFDGDWKANLLLTCLILGVLALVVSIVSLFRYCE